MAGDKGTSRQSVGLKRFREDYAEMVKRPGISGEDILDGCLKLFQRHVAKMTNEESQTEVDRMGSLLYASEKFAAKKGLVRPGNNPYKPN